MSGNWFKWDISIVGIHSQKVLWAMTVAGFMAMPREVQFKLKPRGDWAFNVIQREWKSAEICIETLEGNSRSVFVLASN
jgi:hypothetical protein